MGKSAECGLFEGVDQVILGLDPAVMATGWAVVLAGDDGSDVVFRAEVFRPGAASRLAILAALYEWVGGVVQTWRPHLVAIESVFMGPNAKTSLMLAEVGAVCRLAALHNGTMAGQVFDVTPAERCVAMGLAGNATKAEVLLAVNTLYRCEITDHNAADAVAVALAGRGLARCEALGLT